MARRRLHGDAVITLEEAWSAVHDALPDGWVVGRASERPERRQWLLCAFDPCEQPVLGVRSHEWIAVSPTELGSCSRWHGAFAS